MLKLLRISATGYKMLEDSFEIDFLTKTKVMEDDYESGVFRIDNNLNSLNAIVLTGGNSSGKSTLLNLILYVCEFLKTGRWENNFSIRNNNMEIEIDFYLNGYIYFYSSTIGFDTNDDKQARFYNILDERITKLKYNPAKGRKILGLASVGADITELLLSGSIKDTSRLSDITSSEIYYESFNTNNLISFNYSFVTRSFFEKLLATDSEIISELVRLLDESVEYIICEDERLIRFKRYNSNELIISPNELVNILSSGTFRGLELFIRAIDTLKNGGILIVDEIENCYHRNIVFSLLFLFIEEMNINNAQLIFSTHYTEILDCINRQDAIFIMHKENGLINIKNLKEYNIRVALSKSKQFENNTFNTSMNYNQLMKVRRIIKNGLCSNNDRRN